MPNEKENKYIISSEQEAKEKAQAAMQAQALARAKRRQKKQNASASQTKQNKENPLVVFGKSKKSTRIRLNSGHIVSLLALSVFVDLIQISIGLLDFTSKVTNVTDYLAKFALYIPVIGALIFGAYQTVKLSLLSVIWVTKSALNLTIFLLGKIFMSVVWWLAGVNLLVRAGLKLEPELKAKAIFMIPIRLVAGFFEIAIPIFPGFTILTMMQIQRVRNLQKLLEKKALKKSS